MTFAAGTSGNPKGRKRGSVNRCTKLLKSKDVAIWQKIIDKALDDDDDDQAEMLKLCAARTVAPARSEPQRRPIRIEGATWEAKIDSVTALMNAGDVSIEDGKGLITAFVMAAEAEWNGSGINVLALLARDRPDIELPAGVKLRQQIPAALAKDAAR